MANEFNERQKIEQESSNNASISALVTKVNELLAMALENKKEVRKIREDLRNFDKLRPLRKVEEETK